MAKKRGPQKRKDGETTRQLLIGAVGLILKEKGYSGLGVNKVALRAGVDKTMIYWYFGSYNNLLKEYISGKDFWTPIFEKFHLSDSPQGDELQDYLRSIFIEHFKYFFSEREMQEFIYWQVSEANTLLREISEEREYQGAKIARLTDPYFAGSGISLRAVLSLILGGIHYVVWHARNNKSVVCGNDINVEKDREDLIRSIGQIIDWAWEAAGRAKK